MYRDIATVWWCLVVTLFLDFWGRNRVESVDPCVYTHYFSVAAYCAERCDQYVLR